MKRARVMAWAVVLVVGLGVAILTSQGAKPEGVPPGTGDVATQFKQAVANLESDDYTVVRDAIEAIGNLLDAPNVNLALRPLIKVLSCRDGYYDSYTRSMAAHALTRLGMKLETPRGDEAIDAVIDEVLGGNMALTRMACVKALSLTGRDDAFIALIDANELDPDAMVRAVACEALLYMQNGAYSSPTCNLEEETLLTPMGARAASSDPLQPALGLEGVELERWIKNHVLLPPSSLPGVNAPTPSQE